jgi:RNA polymerase-binding protein DksA
MIDEKTREELEQKLLEEKKRIEENLAKTETGEKGVDREYETKFTEIERDEEENADEMEMYESNLAVDESMKAELEKIDAALERMKNGTYGKCANCQKEIPLERLRAYPQAEACLDCKK